jgi:hypothetical protein
MRAGYENCQRRIDGNEQEAVRLGRTTFRVSEFSTHYSPPDQEEFFRKIDEECALRQLNKQAEQFNYTPTDPVQMEIMNKLINLIRTKNLREGLTDFFLTCEFLKQGLASRKKS